MVWENIERTEDSVWSSKCRTFKVSGRFPRRQLSKTWNQVIKEKLKEMKISKDLQVFTKYLRQTLVFM